MISVAHEAGNLNDIRLFSEMTSRSKPIEMGRDRSLTELS
jgi:hypothetical protein